MHIWHSTIRQIAKFCSITPGILKFDEVMPYHACSPRGFLHFHNTFITKHELLIFDNKQMAKMHKLLGYYSYKNS